jgi:hypothetical protein
MLIKLTLRWYVSPLHHTEVNFLEEKMFGTPPEAKIFFSSSGFTDCYILVVVFVTAAAYFGKDL